jgi:hypothetical protein
MAKVRTTLALSAANHEWLRELCPTTGDMGEYIDRLIQRERTLGPIEFELQRHVDRLGTLLAQSQPNTRLTEAA